MAYVAKNYQAHLILRRLRISDRQGSNRAILIGQCRFASDQKNIPLKFSETAAFEQRRSDRPTPTSKYLVFWESMEAKTKSYKVLNRLSGYASLFVFMFYFCILREENDMDEELTKPLWQRLPSLEEQVVHERIILGKSKGEDVSKYEERYTELQEIKRQEQERLLRRK